MKAGWQLTDDETLLRGCREGDEGAWAEVMKRYRGAVYAASWRIGIAESHIGDVMQDTFLALHRKVGEIKSADALTKWISVTASRLAIRYQNRSRRNVMLDHAENVPCQEDATVAVERTESRTEIERALQSMPAETVELLKMLYVDELSYAEVSERTGRPLGSIGPTRMRSLSRLRKSLERLHAA